MEARLQFEWDDEKATANYAKHGITFKSATRIFADPESVHIDASRSEDDEARRKVLGIMDGWLFSVVYTVRGETHRLISARRANRKEERLWLDSH